MADARTERDKIRDRDLAIMDAIAAKHGEGHHLFWVAMQVATENLRAHDERRAKATGAA